jgi:hypothetical protein
MRRFECIRHPIEFHLHFPHPHREKIGWRKSADLSYNRAFPLGAANRAPMTRDGSRRKRWIPSPPAAALSRVARAARGFRERPDRSFRICSGNRR